MHENSVLLFQKYVIPVLKDGMKVLEIGPDSFPSTYYHLAEHISVFCWDTLDIYEHPGLTYQKSEEYNFKIESGFYDVVLSGQVIEHVKKPWIWIRELARVTAPGGLVITIGPVSWTYHEFPVDCWRIYPEGMKSLYEEAGLTTILSCWESLETPGYRKYTPSTSTTAQNWRKQLFYRLFGVFGFPVKRAYDTIAIGRKG